MPARFKGGGSTGGGSAGFTDGYSVGLVVADSSAAPTDADGYAIAYTETDTNAGHTETVTLGLPAGNFGDTSTAPSDGNSLTMRVWLTGNSGTGVSNPSNADGQNNGTNAVVQTAVAGPTSETMTSPIGPAIPAGLTLTSVLYRGWFSSANTLITSTGTITARSTSALFSDVVMFSNSAGSTTVNHMAGTFTYDLVAAGVDTSAKFASLEIVHRTSDAAAGVTPHVLTVDAGCLEIVGAFA